MTPDPEPHFSQAPAPTVDERSVKTEIIDRSEGGPKAWKLVAGILLFFLIAGSALYAGLNRSNDGGAASVSTEVAAVGDGSGEVATEAAEGSGAVSTAAGDTPKECAGEIADDNLRWYCSQFLPFAKKAAADHGRIDRLEAKVKELENAGGSGVPLALWVVVIAFGLLTVYNTVQILSKKDATPPSA